MKPVVALGVAASLALAPTPAHAESDVSVKMLGSGWYDAGFVTLNLSMIVIGTRLIHPARHDRPPLDGLGHRPRVDALGRAADYSVAIGLATGAGLAFLNDLGSGLRGAERFRGPVIVLEGALAGSAFTQLLKNAFGVCRPRDWDDETRTCTTKGETLEGEEAIDEAHRSFPSGHSAPLAGMAGAALGLFALPTPHHKERIAVALTSIGFALTCVVLRERAGAHSWVDTGAAFISGGLAGFVTAALHLQPVTGDGPATAPTMLQISTPF